MRTNRTPLFIVSAGMAVLLYGAETRIQEKDLPAAVRETLKAQSTGAQIRSFSKETEGGKIYYEAETTIHGHSRDILMDASGAVIEVEEQVSLESVPEPARAAIVKRAGAGKLIKVELVTRGAAAWYEAAVSSGGRRAEYKVNREGKAIQ